MDEKTFWESAKENPSRVFGGTPCLEWQRAINKETGYGAVSWNGVCGTGAHRVSYTLTYGAIPGGKQVLHKCDNKRCIEPMHLYAGTHQDNVDDWVVRNIAYKQRRKNKRALREYRKWIDANVLRYRSVVLRGFVLWLYDRGMTMKRIGQMLGCSESTISRVIAGNRSFINIARNNLTTAYR